MLKTANPSFIFREGGVGGKDACYQKDIGRVITSVDLYLLKALYSLDPDKLQLHCLLGLGTLFCCSFFCSLDQPCKTLQKVAPIAFEILVEGVGFIFGRAYIQMPCEHLSLVR